MQFGSVLVKFQTMIDRATHSRRNTCPKPPFLSCHRGRPPTQTHKEEIIDSPIDESVKPHSKMARHILEAGNLTIAVVEHITNKKQKCTNECPGIGSKQTSDSGGQAEQQRQGGDLVRRDRCMY